MGTVGDRIIFGSGPKAARLGSAPTVNLQLAVARVPKNDGAAEAIAQMMEDG